MVHWTTLPAVVSQKLDGRAPWVGTPRFCASWWSSWSAAATFALSASVLGGGGAGAAETAVGDGGGSPARLGAVGSSSASRRATIRDLRKGASFYGVAFDVAAGGAGGSGGGSSSLARF